MSIPQPVVFAREAHADHLRRLLPERTIFVKNRRELFGAMFSRGALAFVDFDLLDIIEGDKLEGPIVALMENAPADALPAMVRALEKFPWLSHFVQAPLLSMDRARTHFADMVERLSSGNEVAFGTGAVGRTARLSQASKRMARFDRMREFFGSRGISDRMTEKLVDVSEELVMNALYNAPTEAGFFKRVHSRAEDVELPPDRACEISYGVDDNVAFVRARDSFGAFKRNRLLDVLSRCSTQEVALDERNGGAGLGMWRIFSSASSICLSVIPNHVTEITVAIGKNDSRRVARPLSVELYFGQGSRAAQSRLQGDEGLLMDQSITLFRDGSTPTPNPC